jgi:hypothetical protein
VCTKKRGIDRERRGGEKEREEEEEEGRLGEIETGTEGWSDEEGGERRLPAARLVEYPTLKVRMNVRVRSMCTP